MSDLMFPKTKKAKKKLIKNKKPTINDRCIITGRPYAELHEVFYGPYSQKSKEHKLQVRLCVEYHRCSPSGIHGGNSELDHVLKVKAQMQWQLYHDKTEKDFKDAFGTNYIALYENEARNSHWWIDAKFKLF